jgi:Flp pilus assembly protein TadB
MPYRVRNEDGELQFQTMDDLRDAYAQQLVEAEDEVLEDGASSWRKAGSFPALVQARKARPTALEREGRWYLLAMILLCAGVYFVAFGWTMVSFAVVAAIVAGFLVWTTFASTRRRRR